MATITCPRCGLPRAEELFGSAPCPVCGMDQPLSLDDSENEPADDRPWIIEEGPAQPPAEVTAPIPPRSLGAVPGFLAGLAVGIVGTLGWQILPAPTPSDGTAAPVPAPVPVVESVPAPAPVESSPPKAVVQEPPPVPFNPFRPATSAVQQLDNLDGTSSPFVRPGSTLVLKGRVKKLVVSGLEAEAVLDCSELEAREVIVTGKIADRSRLSVRADSGKVVFLSPVDGHSKVDVKAPGGMVVFEDGAAIGGGSEVQLTAQAITLRGRIHGADTQVWVALTHGGALHFVEIAEAARLTYGKSKQTDPAVRLIPGTIHPPATVKEVER